MPLIELYCVAASISGCTYVLINLQRSPKMHKDGEFHIFALAGVLAALLWWLWLLAHLMQHIGVIEKPPHYAKT